VEQFETVFVTQRFDGKKLKNIYHVEVSPETYFELEKLRRQLNLKTHSQVIRYLLAQVTKPSDTDNIDEIFNWLINNISCLNEEQITMLLEAMTKSNPEIVCQVADILRTGKNLTFYNLLNSA
jgi:hypothetical protein